MLDIGLNGSGEGSTTTRDFFWTEPWSLCEPPIGMGYNIRIIRGPDWFDNPAHQISKSEWLDHICSDAELSIQEAGGDHESVTVLLPRGPLDAEGTPWLRWARGVINTKGPDKPTLLKMLQIAEALDAFVEGDDRERYFARGGDIWTKTDEAEWIVM